MKLLAGLVVSGVALTAQAATTNISAAAHDEAITQFPVEQAMVNILTKQADRTMHARYKGRNLRLRDVITPVGQIEFDGRQVMGAQLTRTRASDEEVFSTSVGVNYFTLAPLTFYGFTTSDGLYSIGNQHAVIPKLASIGDSSTYITENVYADSSKRKQVAKYTQAWSLSKATKDTAWLRIQTSENLTNPQKPNRPINEYYEINNKGEILASGEVAIYLDGDQYKTIAYKNKCLQPKLCAARTDQ